MFKYIFTFSFISVITLQAVTVESGLGVNIGMTSTKIDNGAKFDNPTIGMTYQDNTYALMPRVDLEYVKLKNEEANSLLKGSLNGVYEFENSTKTTPYIVAGVGYEYVSGAVKDVFESHPFVHGGVGLTIEIPKAYKMNLEGKYLQILGGNNEDNELMITAGVTIPFGDKKASKPVPKSKPVDVKLEPLVPSSIQPKGTAVQKVPLDLGKKEHK